MRNPLTFRVESWIGGLPLVGVASFFVALMFTAQSSFSSDLDVDVATATQVQRGHKTGEALAQAEHGLIDAWVVDNGITVPPEENIYKFVIENYPDKPWRK